MKVHFEIEEKALYTTDEVMGKIAKQLHWMFEPSTECRLRIDDNTLFRVTDKTGRKGWFSVLTYEVEWDDGEFEDVFDGGDNAIAYSVSDFLDVSTALWVQDEDDNYFLYTE